MGKPLNLHAAIDAAIATDKMSARLNDWAHHFADAAPLECAKWLAALLRAQRKPVRFAERPEYYLAVVAA